MTVFIGSLIAIAVAIFGNFLMNNYWTWRSNRVERKFNFVQSLWRYYAASSVSAIINYAVLFVLFHYFGIDYMLANLLGISGGAMINFFLSHFWVFSNAKKQPEMIPHD